MTSESLSLDLTVHDLERRFGVVSKQAAECPTHGAYAAIIRKNADTASGCPGCAADAQLRRDQDEQRAMYARIAEERLERKLGASMIPKRFMGKTFADFRAETPEQKANLAKCVDYAQSFPKHLDEGRCIVMTGTPGTGKTHLAAAIAGHIIAHHNATAVYRTVGGLLQYIKGSYGDRAEYSEKEAFASLIDPSLLIIDEVGATKPTEFELATLFAVINGRYEEQLPTIVISNIDAKELGAVLGDRSVDRLREGRGIGLVFEGASERSKRRAS
ncbi:ATP-binding protein [Pseudomonas amygdali]|uniref:ATP-binding protein n=1 Tax=Pseudomonas amygdali TaxID=47877 RepID=UPI000EFFEA41|nr:ATP-binding protein [Pseudomonas amygdali]RMV55436.1 IstB ATP binding domain-containing protein [Pseudomonas amygdali pv. lachrymans]